MVKLNKNYHIRRKAVGKGKVRHNPVEQFRCWRCKDNRRYTRSELLKRKDGGHIDYCCPVCESVIICKSKERPKNISYANLDLNKAEYLRKGKRKNSSYKGCSECPFLEGCAYADEDIIMNNCSFYKQKSESKTIRG